jgi:hypothetical protein
MKAGPVVAGLARDAFADPGNRGEGARGTSGRDARPAPPYRPAQRGVKATPLIVVSSHRTLYRETPMHVLLVSNNLVRLSFLTCLLRDAGIDSVVLDNQVSTMEGSIGAIPRRLAVSSEDFSRAKRILAEAGEA